MPDIRRKSRTQLTKGPKRRYDGLIAVLGGEAERRAQRGVTAHAERLLAAVSILRQHNVPIDDIHFPRPRKGRAAAPIDAPRSIIPSLFEAAVQSHKSNRLAEGEALYRAILVLDPTHSMVWSNLAAILIDVDQVDEAIVACREALLIDPDHLNAQLNLLKGLDRNGNLNQAIEIFRHIIARHPQRTDLMPHFAKALMRAGRVSEALDVYEMILAAAPTDIERLYEKAEALKALNRVDEAIACFDEVIRWQPDHALANSTRGILMALHSLSNDLDEAASLCLRAANLQPESSPILNNLGVVLQIRNDSENALLLFRQLAAQDPTFAPAYSNIGSILSQRGFFDQADDAFRQAMAIDPSMKESRIEMVKIRRHLCDWSQGAADEGTIRELNGEGTNFLISFMTISSSAKDQLEYTRLAMAKHNSSKSRVGPHNNRFGTDRLRIGYISADFKDHPIGRLIPELIAKHDRSRFEIVGYPLGSDENSKLRHRLLNAFDRFTDLNRMSDAEAAATILADEIDILIDLTGPTAGGRFGIMSLKPAPIQVSFLGIPGTAGADCLDYIIADPFLVPPGQERFYHEQVVRLPHCYQPSDPARPTPASFPQRSEWGLPEEGFVFCSFNNAAKIGPEIFDLWMRLLKSVEGSVLWLYAKAAKARANLVVRAHQCGVSENRLIFADAVPYEPYLARMSCADLFLDTFPYAAGATCNDALWVGLPVLTCVGETYVSRMGGSLLTTLGMPELVTHSLADYERTALDLARNPGRMQALKEQLAEAKETSPLFDMPRFVASLETAYVRMVLRARNGEPPGGFDIADDPMGSDRLSAP